ncbi:MAG: hypothetical protein HY653_08845 [Acidobacteria bacterium]|nr:hypothetical protein [Acidobacteriota bacterium]
MLDSKTFSGALLLAVLCSLLTGAAQMVFKGGLERLRHEGWADLSGLGLLGGAYALLGLSLVVFVVALRHGALSTLYPIVAARYVWVVAVSPFFFADESLNLYKVAGAMLAAVGVAVVARTGAQER